MFLMQDEMAEQNTDSGNVWIETAVQRDIAVGVTQIATWCSGDDRGCGIIARYLAKQVQCHTF